MLQPTDICLLILLLKRAIRHNRANSHGMAAMNEFLILTEDVVDIVTKTVLTKSMFYPHYCRNKLHLTQSWNPQFQFNDCFLVVGK